MNLPTVAPYDRHELALWAGWATAGIAGFAWLEWRGMRKRRDADPTLTAVISRYIPAWVSSAAFGAFKGWLGYHFQLSYEAWRRGKVPDIPR